MVLSLSHIDLDGISCQIVLHNYFPNVTRMNIGYGKIDEYLDILDESCNTTNFTKVFITDLSFSYIQLEKLSKICRKYPKISFYFIDHHPFEEEYKHLILSNFHIIITNKASATKLTNLYIKKNFEVTEYTELDRYVDLVNVYDMWLDNAPDFNLGLVYNDLFWQYGIDHFWCRFSEMFRLNSRDKEKYKEIITRKNKILNKLETSGRILKIGDNDLFMIFIDDYQSHITLDFPGYKIYVIITSRGSISVRLRDIEDKETVKNLIISKISDLPNISSCGGHISAFGVKLIENEPEKLIDFAKEMLRITDEVITETQPK